MTLRLGSVVWLAAVWIALWGQIDARSVIGGVLIAVLLVFGLPNQKRTRLDAFRPLPMLWFTIRYAWLVISSNAVVAWEIATPGSRVREGIVAVPILGASDTVVSLLAHAISGTPGTLIVDIDRGEQTLLYVHVLHLRDVERVRHDILELERLMIRAIGTRQSLVDIEARLAAHHVEAEGGAS